MDWPEFLAARLDEREALALAAAKGPWRIANRHYGNTVVGADNADVAWPGYWERGDKNSAHILASDPSWVLADVASKRAILDEHWRAPNGWGRPTAWCRSCAPKTAYPCKTIRLLCEPWSGHPDYPGKC